MQVKELTQELAEVKCRFYAHGREWIGRLDKSVDERDIEVLARVALEFCEERTKEMARLKKVAKDLGELRQVEQILKRQHEEPK